MVSKAKFWIFVTRRNFHDENVLGLASGADPDAASDIVLMTILANRRWSRQPPSEALGRDGDRLRSNKCERGTTVPLAASILPSREPCE